MRTFAVISAPKIAYANISSQIVHSQVIGNVFFIIPETTASIAELTAANWVTLSVILLNPPSNSRDFVNGAVCFIHSDSK